MTQSDPVATVKRLFSAFEAGDLDALVETVHPESRWTYYGANPRLGHAQFEGQSAVRRFLERILRRLDISEFRSDEYIVQGDTVVIFGGEAGALRETGESFRNEWVQKYVVREGLVVEMAEYNIQVEPGEVRGKR